MGFKDPQEPRPRPDPNGAADAGDLQKFPTASRDSRGYFAASFFSGPNL